MVQISNLTLENQTELKKVLETMKKTNPSLDWSFLSWEFLSEDKEENKNKESQDEIKRLEEKIDTLTRKIDLIFGEHFLMNGQFIQIR